MTLTVKQAFDTFLSRIELNPTRVNLASQRYNAIKKTAEGALPGKTVRQIGSFQRKTKIRPSDLSDTLDVDAIVSFGAFSKYAPYGKGITQKVAIEIVRDALASSEVYRVMEPEQDAPAVVLEYADKFKIELVPAFVDKTGNHSHGPEGPDCYIIAGTYGKWIPADYDYDASYITNANQSNAVQCELVPAIKIIKAYLRTVEPELKSFHIELLATLVIPRILENWKLRYSSWGYHHILAVFLSLVPQYLTGPVALPGSFSEGVNSGLSSLQLIKTSIKIKQKGGEAWAICNVKEETDAVIKWKNFVGDPFPNP